MEMDTHTQASAFLESMTLATHPHETIEKHLEVELAQVQSCFTRELTSDLQCVNTLVAHIERYRGKMLRPKLVLATSMACNSANAPLNHSHHVLATVVEMVHMATLVHDDILDDAQMRRRGYTVNHLDGNETAVMLGDYLISHAYHLCSSLERQTISRAIAQTTNTVCEGELFQLANRKNWSLDESTYFEIIRRKTASLCGICCQLAAELCECDQRVVEDMYGYGENIGLAFQIVDDLLDLMGTEGTVGKTLGRDIGKGKLTLPMIRFLKVCDQTSKPKLIKQLANQDTTPSPELLEELRNSVRSSGAADYAVMHARKLINQAKSHLMGLPQSPARAMLETMSESVLTRTF
mgnify:CR=1 FL=1|tara:strand:+ start:3254 stop:4306 length:1053 start_codon:yes stop_codon:yes gene_type:complete